MTAPDRETHAHGEPTPDREPHHPPPATAVDKPGTDEALYELGPRDSIEVDKEGVPQLSGAMNRAKKSPQQTREESVRLPGQANQAINLAEPGIWEALDASEMPQGPSTAGPHGHKEAGDSTGH